LALLADDIMFARRRTKIAYSAGRSSCVRMSWGHAVPVCFDRGNVQLFVRVGDIEGTGVWCIYDK
jgi:hypothetical protein